MKTKIDQIYGKLETENNNSCWVAARTKPRHEKKVARFCKDYNISYYLPLKKSVRKYQYREKTYWKPLFPGYIFCKTNSQKRRDIYSMGSVLTFLFPNSQKQLVSELKKIYDFHNLGTKLVQTKYLKKGKKVKVIRGPFEGYKGRISKRKNKYRLVLNISLIKQAVSVEVDVKDITFI